MRQMAASEDEAAPTFEAALMALMVCSAVSTLFQVMRMPSSSPGPPPRVYFPDGLPEALVRNPGSPPVSQAQALMCQYEHNQYVQRCGLHHLGVSHITTTASCSLAAGEGYRVQGKLQAA